MNGWVLTGGTLTLDGVAPYISNAGTVRIDSQLTALTGLTKDGGGALTVNGATSINGGLTVNAGTLTLNGNTNLDAAPVVNGGTLSIQGTVNAYVGGALTGTRFTGVGALTVNPGVHMTNDANDYTGRTHFSGAGGSNFTSIGNLGEASSLGAPTTVADGRINIANPSGTTGSRSVSYIGDGDVSDRNWTLTSNGYRGTSLINNGTGTLTLTGAIAVNKTSLAYAPAFTAGTADLELLGVISGNDVAFNANAGRVLRLGNANTFSAGTIGGAGKVEAATLANISASPARWAREARQP
jgi:fibronectin-binding autotransporter adhesin